MLQRFYHASLTGPVSLVILRSYLAGLPLRRVGARNDNHNPRFQVG